MTAVLLTVILPEVPVINRRRIGRRDGLGSQLPVRCGKVPPRAPIRWKRTVASVLEMHNSVVWGDVVAASSAVTAKPNAVL